MFVITEAFARPLRVGSIKLCDTFDEAVDYATDVVAAHTDLSREQIREQMEGQCYFEDPNSTTTEWIISIGTDEDH